jgi:hypothetical protein
MVQAASRCVKDREDGRWYGCVRGGWALEDVSHLDDALVMLGRAVGKLSIGRAVMWKLSNNHCHGHGSWVQCRVLRLNGRAIRDRRLSC